MKKYLKLGISALVFAFVFTALSNLGAVKASAETLSADLDGDGKEETIVYETAETDDYAMEIISLTVNGKDVLSVAKFEDQFEANRINVEVIDTCTKDGLKELAVIKGVDSWDIYTLFRFKDGKVSQYCIIDGAEDVVSQKKKNTVATKGYIYVRNLGNIRVTTTYKVKSGKLTNTDPYISPNKDNSTTTFKTNRKITLYSDETGSEKIGTIKKGKKFKLVKVLRDEDSEDGYTWICVKSNGTTGWINTADYDDFFIKNPPLWN
ncbi:MAG: hypothetical protein IK071_03960 [Lachnospiraceae bacterium]|nr:hypothetical protein [Lachnospiraceae bacterium]MBR4724918.1 hypothetical protein [Lachnospiraceae bacterium]